MRKLLSILFSIAILGLALAGPAFAEKEYPAPSQDFYVNDLANVLSEENEKYIIDTNVELRAKTGGQIVVMTVNNLGGEDIESYSINVARKYGIGDKEKNNGTLILLAIEDRTARIELGYGTEGFISDSKSGRIQREYMVPSFKNDDWDTGLRQGFDAILGCYLEEYGIEIDGNTAKYLSEEESDAEDTFLTASFIALFVGTPFISMITQGNSKTTKFIRNAIRILCIAGAAGTFFSGLLEPTKVMIYMMLFVVFLATFGISTSGGSGRSRGWSSGGSSGGHSGGGGSFGGGGSTSRF